MKRRIVLLSLVLLLRFILGFFETQKYPQQARIRVTGNIDNVYLNNSKCIINTGRFWVDFRGECLFSRSSNVELVGSVWGSVIDRFLGRLWLTSAKITVKDKDSLVDDKRTGYIVFFNSIREKISDQYLRFLPVPESGLVAGIVLGDKKNIGQSLYQQMINSGTIHIAVASGYNVMLVGGAILGWSFWFLRRKWATVVAVLAMVMYAVVAGGEPPVLRAVVMASLIYMAAAVGRKVVSWWILLVALWMMLLIDPGLIMDIGFQLSVSASIGLIVVEPWLGRLLEEKDTNLYKVLVAGGLLTTISTMLLTLPVIWWHFGRVSLLGIFSNILILPFVPLLMVLGVLMLAFPGVLFLPVYVVAHWMILVIEYFGL